MARRVLITGAKGFVGTYLRAALARRSDLRVTSLVAPSDAGGTDKGADLLDAAAVDAVIADVRPDIVVHLASQSSVARTAEDGGRTFAVNLGGSLNLALAVARHVPESLLLFASSSEVYGASFLAGPARESTRPLPLNDYAKSKYLAESMFAAVLPDSTRLVVARPFNHTGAGQREDFVLPSFAAQVARIEAGVQEPLMHVGNLDVSRDFLDVRDVVDAYLALIEAAPRLPTRFTCNIASGCALPLRERLETLRQMSKVPFEICVDPARLRRVDVPVAVGDSTLLRSVTGWTPRLTIADTLQSLLDAARATGPTR